MQNLIAATLAGVKWAEDGAVVGFASTRGEFGVTDGAGRWLSFDGVRPYCPRGGRRAAVEVAATVDAAAVSWVCAL